MGRFGPRFCLNATNRLANLVNRYNRSQVLAHALTGVKSRVMVALDCSQPDKALPNRYQRGERTAQAGHTHPP